MKEQTSATELGTFLSIAKHESFVMLLTLEMLIPKYDNTLLLIATLLLVACDVYTCHE